MIGASIRVGASVVAEASIRLACVECVRQQWQPTRRPTSIYAVATDEAAQWPRVPSRRQWCVCVCVRACVCACVRVRVRARARVCVCADIGCGICGAEKAPGVAPRQQAPTRGMGSGR